MNKYQESLDYLRTLERKERLSFTNQVAPQPNCDVMQELVDKATPKKLVLLPMDGYTKEEASYICCPYCHKPITNGYSSRKYTPMYCSNCGQALDWSEDEKAVER